jgi:YD repeat-containing protein
MVPFGDDNARRSWSSGTYVHDGTGNITKIGPAWFTYDKVNRLTAGNVYTNPLGGGTGTQQGYTFDPFGNLTAITGAKARNTPTAAATNRLTSGTYDAAGNLTNWNGAVYQYDRFNQMLRMTSGSQDWAYVYTADDERIWSYDLAEQEPSRWTLRDLSGQVLREYLNDNGAWTVDTDYIHRNGQLFAAETRLGRRHFHLDRFAAIEERSAILGKVIQADGSLNVSDTVRRQVAGLASGKDRKFIPVQSILDTIGSGTRVVDPQKVKNHFLYAAEATYKKSKGVLEVVVNEKTGQVVHVLFRSIK